MTAVDSATKSVRFVRTRTLDIAYEEHGPADGDAVILLHGFPYDPRCYDEMAIHLAGRGYRAIVPYLRGYGPTRFLSAETMRSGQQGAIGRDLRDLMDGLDIDRAALVGYDWGGRAACIVAALWPERVRCLVSGEGYNIQDIPGSVMPLPPDQEHRFWYQFYFHGRRGHDGLAANRYGLCRLLWSLWSPSWKFDEATYAASARSFDNPDFVDIVIHSYRHRYGYAPGDPAYDETEEALEKQPVIPVPTVALHGADDGVDPPADTDMRRDRFTGFYERRLLTGIGHNFPQEAPAETLRALYDLLNL